MSVAICFTNFGPYHLARLRALASRLALEGDRLIAYEMADSEWTYPWRRSRDQEPFEWVTLFADRALETVEAGECRRAIRAALDRDQPGAVCIVGYSRPESMAAAGWANRHDRPAILLSESQSIDRPRVWWKELIKKRRVSRFQAALVGGPRHRDYLTDLGMPADQITLGYNAVDNEFYASTAERQRRSSDRPSNVPCASYFLCVCRFVGEKNLVRLIEAFARYRDRTGEATAWDLVLCGAGAAEAEIEAAIAATDWSSAIHRPGFLQADELAPWYAHADAFVLASLSEPWGLVVNEAAAASLPLLVSDRAGCAPTLVPTVGPITGAQFNPLDINEMALRLSWMANCSDEERADMGRNAARTVAQWGPERFAQGTIEALELARQRGQRARTTRDVVTVETR